MENLWSDAEEALFRAAKAAPNRDSDSPQDLPRQLLNLGRVVFERAHMGTHLRKSIEFVRLLRLFNSDHIFAGNSYFDERIDFILDILEGSPQRPVLNCAALIALELEFEYNWSTDSEPRRERFLKLAQDVPNPVMSLIALESKIRGEPIASRRLVGQTFDDRRLRLVELIEVVDTYTNDRTLKELINATFEAIFDNTTNIEKSRLIQRLMEHLEGRKSMKRHNRWTLMIDPMLLQNKDNASLKSRILQFVAFLPGDQLNRYMRFYLETTDIDDLDAKVVLIGSKCGIELIPLLSPIAQDKSFFGQSSLARTATRVRNAIIEREGVQHMSGGLTLQDVDPLGGLSISAAKIGPLSLEHGIREDASAPSWKILGAIGIVTAGVVALLI